MKDSCRAAASGSRHSRAETVRHALSAANIPSTADWSAGE
jgi:hypothetical protein